MNGERRVALPVSAGIAALLGVAAILIPARCQVNELGHHHAEHRGDLRLGPAPIGDRAARMAAACGAPGETTGGIRRKPYLQKVSSTGATVVWTTADAGAPDAQVLVWRGRDDSGGGGGAAVTVKARPDTGANLLEGRQLLAELDGLAPGTLHCYELRVGGRRAAGPFGFTTAPARGTGATLKMIAFGDMGYRTTDQRAVLARMQRVDADLVLLAGDIAYTDGTLEEFEHNFFSVYAPMMQSAAFFPASGNHDYRTDDAEPFRQVFVLPENGGPAGLERWYSFDWGDAHIVVLDTEQLGRAQEAWLDADLTATDARWVIALFHKAPFSSGARGADDATAHSLVPILARHRVPLVITGHEHHYERFEPIGPTTFIITGGGGRGTRPVSQHPPSALAEQVAHFVYLEVDATGIRLWAIDATGQTFDTVKIER
ncbi:MAG TPA: metallophosphoesterase family protein [Kofleriaceae bacterium]|nr:metallophosphoesterase family protein [Kofleriaceae bacterium]